MSGNPSETAVNVLSAGLNLTSTATAALNGTYAVTGMVASALQAQSNALALSGTFADGTQTLAWPDTAGTTHSFDIEQFKAFALAVANFVNQCTQYAMGIVTTEPSNSATIP